MHYKRCEICGVKSGRNGFEKRLFMAKFPLDEERCKLWVKVVGKEDLAYVPIEKLHMLRHLCRKHFKAKDFNKKNTQLKRTAVPSINLTNPPLNDEILAEFPLHVEKHENLNIEGNRSSIFDEHNYYKSASSTGKRPISPELTSQVYEASTTPEHKPLQSSPPEERDPLALEVKLEHEDSDTEMYCLEEPVYDDTNEEKVIVFPFAGKPGDMNKNANPVPPILKGILTTSDAVNIAPRNQAITSLPKALLSCLNMRRKIILREVDPNNQKQVVHPTAQLPQSDSTASLTNLPPHDIALKRLRTELEQCKKENFKLRKELHTLRKQNKLLEKRLTRLKRTRNDKKAMFDKLTANMSAPAKALFEMQFQSKKKIRGRRYSLPGRIIALSIYKASPACYSLLSKYFVLPSKRVLEDIMANARKQIVTDETTIANETNTNEPENEENQEMLLDGECKMDDIEDLDLNDYNVNNTIQQEIDKTSEAVDYIVDERQAIKKKPQIPQVTEDMDQMTDTSEVQSIELCEGEALQLADGRIFQLIDGQIVEVVGEQEINVPSDDTRGTGSSDEQNPTVNDPQSTQVCEQGTFIDKPLRRYGRTDARDEQTLLSETLPQNNVSSTQQTIIGHHQQSHRASYRNISSHSMTIEPNSFDGRLVYVDELRYPWRSQVPHRTKQHHTKHKQATKETSSFSDMSRMVTLPVTNLKRVATDKEPLTSPTSAAQLYRVQQSYRKRLKIKKTTRRGPDKPDLTFS